jgi:CBS domain-containing protein
MLICLNRQGFNAEETIMTVQHVLGGKSHELISTQPHRTLGEAASMLASKRIGAVVVTGADSELLGILSERDIIRAIGEHGAGALEKPVSKFMTAKVITCSMATTLDHLMQMMTAGRFRHVPVVEHGKLVGIISIGDVVKARVAEIEGEAQAMRDYIAMA